MQTRYSLFIVVFFSIYITNSAMDGASAVLAISLQVFVRKLA